MLGQTFCLGAFYKFVELLCMYNCTKKYTFGAFNSSLQILTSWGPHEGTPYVLIGKIFFCILQDVLRCDIIQFFNVFFCIWCVGSVKSPLEGFDTQPLPHPLPHHKHPLTPLAI